MCWRRGQKGQAVADVIDHTGPGTSDPGFVMLFHGDANLQEQTAERGTAQYRAELRSAVRGLWSGALDYLDAWETFDIAIHRSFTQAYHDGAKEVGVLPTELTPQERIALRQAIQQETQYIDGFLTTIESRSKANGGKLGPLFNRVEQWVQRYQQMYTDGQMAAKNDPKMLWVRTAAESCPSCLAVEGKVKRMSTWKDSGYYPQSPRLQCMSGAKGVTVCKCHLEPTDQPMTRGPLPMSALA